MNTLILEQIITEDTLSKSNIASKVLKQIEQDDAEFKVKAYYTISKTVLNKYAHFLEYNELHEIVYGVLSKILLINKTELLTVTAGKIARTFEGEYLACVELAGAILGELSDTDVLDIHLRGTFLVVEPHYTLPEHIQEYILNTSYLPPMLVKPKPVNNNHTSGHLSFKKSLLLGNKSHNLPLNYTAINRLNSVRFVLDERILEIEEESSKPLDTAEKKQNFKNNVKAYNETYEHIGRRPFYFTNNYDDRGRTYCGGWQISYQGTDYKKAILNLAHKERIPLD